MRKDLLILLLVLIPAGIFLVLLSNQIKANKSQNTFALSTPYPTAPIDSSGSLSAGSITPTASINIEVLAPLMGESVKSGFLVKGNARTFESVVNIRLTDSYGNILVETNTLANAPDVGSYGPFDKVINFYTDDSEGELEVFQYSAKDGSEIDKVVIPLIFSQ